MEPGGSETALACRAFLGEVPERLNGHDWKSCDGETRPGVRIPLSPLKLRRTVNRNGAKHRPRGGSEHGLAVRVLADVRELLDLRALAADVICAPRRRARERPQRARAEVTEEVAALQRRNRGAPVDVASDHGAADLVRIGGDRPHELSRAVEGEVLALGPLSPLERVPAEVLRRLAGLE